MRATWRVLADDADITPALQTHLVSLRLTDRQGLEADEVEITLFDTGTIALPERGVRLSVSFGWGEAVDKGDFLVDEVRHEGPPDIITIIARSADFQGPLKENREDSYDRTTLGAILETIAARQSLIAAVHPDLASVTVDHLDQTNESDANVLTRLGEDHDAVATIKSGRLLFVPIGTGETASGAALPAITISRATGDRHSFTVSDRDGSTTGVKARWHDLETGETRLALAGEEGSTKTLKRDYPNEAEARAAATAEWARHRRRRHEMRLSLAYGNPGIIATTPLRVTGFRPEIDGIRWITGDITHTLDGDAGFTTEIAATEAE